MAMKQLSDDQLVTFDTEYVTQALWEILTRHIDRTHPDGRFSFLDIGGGNGVFADRLLAAYPAALGAVLDNSRLLLDRNKPNPRKTLIEESAENLDRLDGRYDLVFFNWVLHHLVGDGYGKSVVHVDQTLRKAAALLTPEGHISIFENMYNGLIVDNAPSHIIFNLTSAKAIAPIIRRFGANTGGLGVCFQSKSSWQHILRNAGIASVDYDEDSPWSIPLSWKTLLHVGNIRCGNFWGRPASAQHFSTGHSASV